MLKKMNEIKKPIKVKILGKKYSASIQPSGSKGLEGNCQGYTNSLLKKMVICDLKTMEWTDEKAIKNNTRNIIRHEVTHAYMFESGLAWNSYVPKDGWAVNEEMIDWIALRVEDIYKTSKLIEKKLID